MDFALKRKSSKERKVVRNKSVMVLALDKVKLMKVQKMLAIRFSLSNKSRETKINRKIMRQMQIKNRKMIFKWKEILMEIFTLKKSRHKDHNQNKENRSKLINRWDKLTIKRENKI